MEERLQKILSARGICSRRKAEEYILKGLVKVNGKVAELGQKADPEIDKIEVDGEVMTDRAQMLYYLLNKPVGVETTNVDRKNLKFPPSPSLPAGKAGLRSTGEIRNSKNGVKTVRDILPKNLQGKIYPVGRLDKDTSGLLLLTNDGVLAYRLTHPKFYHEKEYEVKVGNEIKDGALKKLEKGITISGEKTKEARLKRIDKYNFRIALTQGKNRQIRRMCQKVGSPVDKLKRIRIVTLKDDKLKQGELRVLTESERDQLLSEVGIEIK